MRVSHQNYPYWDEEVRYRLLGQPNQDRNRELSNRPGQPPSEVRRSHNCNRPGRLASQCVKPKRQPKLLSMWCHGTWTKQIVQEKQPRGILLILERLHPELHTTTTTVNIQDLEDTFTKVEVLFYTWSYIIFGNSSFIYTIKMYFWIWYFGTNKWQWKICWHEPYRYLAFRFISMLCLYSKFDFMCTTLCNSWL